MAVSDPVADMLTKIRNASMAGHTSVVVASSKAKVEIVKILKAEGYINNYKVIENEKGNCIQINLKYDENNAPVIKGIKRLSTPGRRVYSGYKEMPRIYNGYGTLIVSTSNGIITGRLAKEKKVGGELICSVW